MSGAAGGFCWKLLEPFVYDSTVAGRWITVPAGFVHDGESVPLAVRSLAGRDCLRAGTIPDRGSGSTRSGGWFEVAVQLALRETLHCDERLHQRACEVKPEAAFFADLLEHLPV